MRFYEYFFDGKIFAANIVAQNEQRKAEGKKPYRMIKKELCNEGTRYIFSQGRKKYDVYCSRETDSPDHGAMFSFGGDTTPDFFNSEEYKEVYIFIRNAYAAACTKRYTV